MFFFKKTPKWQPYLFSLFAVSSVIFVFLFIAELALPGVVTSWFNPAWLLIIALISGILFTSQETQ